MKKKFPILLFVFGLAVGLIIALTLVWRQPTPTQPVASVALENNKANPSLIAVKTGEYVQFNSRDGREHNLIQDAPHDHSAAGQASRIPADNGMSSGTFKSGEAWKVQFKQAGNYTFYDQHNPNIVVTVVAYNPK